MPESRGRFPKSKPAVRRAHEKRARYKWNRKVKGFRMQAAAKTTAVKGLERKEAQETTAQLLEKARAKAGIGKGKGKLMKSLDKLFNRGG